MAKNTKKLVRAYCRQNHGDAWFRSEEKEAYKAAALQAVEAGWVEKAPRSRVRRVHRVEPSSACTTKNLTLLCGGALLVILVQILATELYEEPLRAADILAITWN